MILLLLPFNMNVYAVYAVYVPVYVAELSSLFSRYQSDRHHTQRHKGRPGRQTVNMEGAESEMNILSNGKGHEQGEDTCVPVKTMPEEDQ